MEKILTKNKSFVDSYGRERIFTGLNIVDKGDYKQGKTRHCFDFNDAFLDDFKAKGFNIIRLGFVWDAVEPEPGKYNEEFLDDIGRILDKCAEKEIYAFLDVHQDLYSSHCYGDGAPAWASLTGKYKPRAPRGVWAEGYFFSKAVHHAFDNFWTNRQVNDTCLQDYYAGMWRHLAERFKDKPALFGYDFMNEPYPGSSGGKVFLKIICKCASVTLTDKRIKKAKMIADALHKDRRIHVLDQFDGEIFCKITSAGYGLIKKFDTEWYSPFLNKMASAVRTVTENGIAFVDNSYWSNVGIPCSSLPIEVGGVREEKQCFSPHGYDLTVDTPAYQFASNSRVGAIFAEHKRTQERLGVPVLVGEWGGNGDGTRWLPHVQYLLETFDQNKWSNTYWHHFDTILDSPLAGVLIRPKPTAVTGHIIEYQYDKDKELFTLDYEQNQQFDVPTVIYAHKPFKSITTDGEYTVENTGNSGASYIYIKTGTGRHKTVINF